MSKFKGTKMLRKIMYELTAEVAYHRQITDYKNNMIIYIKYFKTIVALINYFVLFSLNHFF